MKIDININDCIKVKLTPKGEHILRERHYQLNNRCYNALGEYEPPKTDENGYVEFQLHDLMNIFGKYITPGSNILPFETNMIYERS